MGKGSNHAPRGRSGSAPRRHSGGVPRRHGGSATATEHGVARGCLGPGRERIFNCNGGATGWGTGQGPSDEHTAAKNEYCIIILNSNYYN